MYDGHTMPFPFTSDDQTVATPADLMRRVLDELSDLDVQNQTATWLQALHPTHLQTEELTALAAALATRTEPGALQTAAKLTEHLKDARLGALLLQACMSIDLGALLTPLPSSNNDSVEDVLLRTIVQTADLNDPAIRTRLLTKLRETGHSDLELHILGHHGSALDIVQSLPGLLAEGITISDSQQQEILHRAAEDPDHEQTVRDLLETLR